MGSSDQGRLKLLHCQSGNALPPEVRGNAMPVPFKGEPAYPARARDECTEVCSASGMAAEIQFVCCCSCQFAEMKVQSHRKACQYADKVRRAKVASEAMAALIMRERVAMS